MVNLKEGTSITLAVKDSTGGQQYSSPITIQKGTSTACFGEYTPGGSTKRSWVAERGQFRQQATEAVT